ncbi:MAG: class I SAM-dependent methyltransferase [Chloroflexota bacterium]
MTTPHRLFDKPGLFGVFKDFVNRASRGELHLPPWWLRDVGGSDFAAAGQEFLQYFRQLANLQPAERVLDIGCGSGRMAIPLTGYLGPEGIYNGIDITEESIRWCRQHITRRYPNFRFLHADLYNRRYNPGGRCQARDYVFPFEDQSFDFIFLTSVFTHLLPADTGQYLREIARLLQPSGRALMTFFLLNETQQALTRQGRSAIEFRYGSGPCRLRDEAIPESAVAYDESFLGELLSKCGLVISGPVYYGRWSGREDGLSYQDMLLVRAAEV